jgi:poly-gamma-glutamate capsule biosynthesis protein CapA/YwtB (metallophosphatase superfamily)
MVLNDILEDVRAVRQQVDLVVVSLHWGVEYVDQPSKAQREMAHRLIDEGVDLILGHHPHWLQGLEVYHDKLIAYSLGNFIFDQNCLNRPGKVWCCKQN